MAACLNCNQALIGFNRFKKNGRVVDLCFRCGFSNPVIISLSAVNENSLAGEITLLSKLEAGDQFSFYGLKTWNPVILRVESAIGTGQNRNFEVSNAYGQCVFLSTSPETDMELIKLNPLYANDTIKEAVLIHTADMLDTIKQGLTMIAPAVAVSGIWDISVAYETFKKVLENTLRAQSPSWVPGYAFKHAVLFESDPYDEARDEASDLIDFLRDSELSDAEILENVKEKNPGLLSYVKTLLEREQNALVDKAADSVADDQIHREGVKKGAKYYKVDIDGNMYTTIVSADNIASARDYASTYFGKMHEPYVTEASDKDVSWVKTMGGAVHTASNIKGSIIKRADESLDDLADLSLEGQLDGEAIPMPLKELTDTIRKITPSVVDYAMRTKDMEAIEALGRLVSTIKEIRNMMKSSHEMFPREYERLIDSYDYLPESNSGDLQSGQSSWGVESSLKKVAGIVNIDYEDESHGYGVEPDKGNYCDVCDGLAFWVLLDKGGGGPWMNLCDKHLAEWREKGHDVEWKDLFLLESSLKKKSDEEEFKKGQYVTYVGPNGRAGKGIIISVVLQRDGARQYLIKDDQAGEELIATPEFIINDVDDDVYIPEERDDMDHYKADRAARETDDKQASLKKKSEEDLSTKWTEVINNKDFEEAYKDDDGDREFEDDGFLHIVRDGVRFVFYNGQGKGMLRRTDIPKYVGIVEAAVSEHNGLF